MKKLILLIIVGIFLFNFISAVDDQMLMACGGDDELVIYCQVSDEQLTFFGGERKTGGTIVKVPPTFLETKTGFAVFSISLVLIIACLITIVLVIRKKEKFKNY